MAAVGDLLAEHIEEGSLPPQAYTLDVVTGSASSTWTPGGQGSVSPADPCRTPPGFTEIPLTRVSEVSAARLSAGEEGREVVRMRSVSVSSKKGIAYRRRGVETAS